MLDYLAPHWDFDLHLVQDLLAVNFVVQFVGIVVVVVPELPL
jgi:uncharacterized membrane protein